MRRCLIIAGLAQPPVAALVRFVDHSAVGVVASTVSASHLPRASRTVRAAIGSYRRRLAELDDDEATATRHNDIGQIERLELEREALLAELRHVTTVTGAPRQFANNPTERARKAVSSRIRATITRIAEVHPSLGQHLHRTIITGNQCRDAGPEAIDWRVTTGD